MTDTIIMRPFVFFFLFCTIIQAESQILVGEIVPFETQRVFAVPEKFITKPVNDFPVVIDAVFPDESFPDIAINDLPAVPWFIMGKGEVRAEQLASFLLNENINADRAFAETLAAHYIAEADKEGINHDVAFAQMCLETGFLRFGGLVIPEMNNFCGLGSIGPGEEGIWFPSVELGVRAHIQHLKAYASEDPLTGELVDPRYRFVRRGSALTINGLAGTWAADKLYADKIKLILDRLFSYKPEENKAL
ncbi:MAG: glucosaminidase domain-containing protein [Treponema sp.]|nr:glucosaminidase domain-containing protein [Treponema sp.]